MIKSQATITNLLDRRKQIERLKSRDVNPQVYMFDRLQGPKVFQVISPQDSYDLYNIATSGKLSAKPKEKFKLIDQILTKRGFELLGRGTNRVVYKYLEDASFVLKVAYNSVGTKDNPRELFNQYEFKPFNTKIFDVSPDGTVATVERVEPIKNRYQFLAIADDVFELINYVLIDGEHILADIGTEYWANYGVRRNFGPVLLDFPYIYKIDGEKLYCRARSPIRNEVVCGGIIDYDKGFNYLYCTKCGLHYDISELVKTDQIKLQNPFERDGFRKGDNFVMNMKIVINGVEKTYSDEVKKENNGLKAPVSSIANMNLIIKKPEVKKEEEKKVEEKPVVEESAPAVVEEKKEEKKEVVETTTPVKNTMADNSLDNIAKKTSTTEQPKKSPISLGAVKSYKEQFDDAFKSLINIYSVAKGCDSANTDYYESTMIGLVKDIITNNSGNVEALQSIKAVLNEILPEEDEYYFDEDTDEEASSEEFVGVIKESSVDNVVNNEVEDYTINNEEDENAYTGIAWYQASCINIRSIFANEEDADVLVLNTESGSFAKDREGRLVAIDDIDGTDIRSSKIMSKKAATEFEKELTEEANSNSTGAFPPSNT